MAVKIILISGKSASGKDAVAHVLKEQLEERGKTVLVIHFGDPVKWIARDFFNWDGQKGIEGRQLLQDIGTTMMRGYNPVYWAEIVGQFVAAANKWDYVLIPDLRFQNEYETICKYNNDVTLVRVERFNEDGTKYINPTMTQEQANHISECELDNFAFDFIIENSGTLKDLQASVKTMLDLGMKL